MSREAYHPPTLIPPPQTSSSSNINITGAGTTAAAPSAATIADATRAVQYLCGDCNAKVLLHRGDLVRCKECGHRVLYKERTNRLVFAIALMDVMAWGSFVLMR